MSGCIRFDGEDHCSGAKKKMVSRRYGVLLCGGVGRQVKKPFETKKQTPTRERQPRKKENN